MIHYSIKKQFLQDGTHTQGGHMSQKFKIGIYGCGRGMTVAYNIDEESLRNRKAWKGYVCGGRFLGNA